MQRFNIIDVTPAPYLYIDRTARVDGRTDGRMAGEEIGKAMHSGLGEVWGFMEHHGVPPAGNALAVYDDNDEGVMPFRVGFIVAPHDMEAAQGAVKAAMTPGGRALHFTHTGSHMGLRHAYEDMMGYMAAEGLHPVAPTWEIYLNDPNDVHEEQLLTECYQALAD